MWVVLEFSILLVFRYYNISLSLYRRKWYDEAIIGLKQMFAVPDAANEKQLGEKYELLATCYYKNGEISVQLPLKLLHIYKYRKLCLRYWTALLQKEV